MGTARRIKPARLAEKLLKIRDSLGYNLPEMAAALSDRQVTVHKQDVFRFENAEREPNLIVLLQYARMVKTSMEALVDDTQEVFPTRSKKSGRSTK